MNLPSLPPPQHPNNGLAALALAAAGAMPSDSGSPNDNPDSPVVGASGIDSDGSQNAPSVSVEVIVNNKKKFPAILFNADDPNAVGLRIIKIVLNRVQSAGGWNECFGHGKKVDFLNKTLDAIFASTGQANE
jgi:hypothetical protein